MNKDKKATKTKAKTVIEIEYEFIKDKDHLSCYIPATNSYCAVSTKRYPTLSAAKKALAEKVQGLTIMWMRYWNDRNKKGLALKDTEQKAAPAKKNRKIAGKSKK